jgi:hypothetical protein
MIYGSVEEMLLDYWDGKDLRSWNGPFPFDSIILHAQNHKGTQLPFPFIGQERSFCTQYHKPRRVAYRTGL